MNTSLSKIIFLVGTLLVSSVALITADVGKCSNGVQYCQYSHWDSWDICNVTFSGKYKQIRLRTLCCKVAMDCLKNCNISNYVYRDERTCTVADSKRTKLSAELIVGVCFGVLVSILIAVIVTLVLLHRFKKIALFTRWRKIEHKDADTKTET